VTPPFPRTAVVDDGRLVEVGGVALDRLAEEFGTPLYVVDHAEIAERAAAYRAAFGEDAIVTYAAKALCVTGVLQLAVAAGLHVDVASAGELRTAEVAGVPPERIVFHGNNKSIAELEQAMDLGVGRIVADSFTELDRLEELAWQRGSPLAVVLRITPGVGAGGHAYVHTGQDDSKFGFTLSAGLADAAVARVADSAHLSLRGLHCHVGSQVVDPDAYDLALEAMVGFMAVVRDRHGLAVDELNLGGGLGIAYGPQEAEPDIAAYARALRDGVRRECERHGLEVPRLFVEPGRSLVGPAGCTLYRVGTVKDVPGVRTFVAVDGGMSDNLRPALYGSRYTFALAGTTSRPRTDDAGVVVTVVGKHCESGDVLGTDVVLPAVPAVGELLAVAATGAYGYAMANNYNRMPRAAMVLVRDGEARLLVRRETVDDLLSHDVPLDG
jgi:diaminopimelate decarboxylase